MAQRPNFALKRMAPWRFLFVVFQVLLHLCGMATADIGLVTFWVPELHALLDSIQQEGAAPVETHVFGARRFYTTSYKGHRVVVVNGGESVSNSAATTAILLQKFPNVDRIVGSGTAGGVVSLPGL